MHPFAHPGSASRRLPSVAGALLAAVVLLLTVAQAATAAGPAPFAGGLHISTGTIVDPAGRTWVADHNAGFCRVSDPAPPELGTIEHPQTPGADGPRTCLGGLLPEAAIGPDAAGAPALVDPTPDIPGNGDEVALIPDGASPSNSVWRAHWNPGTGLFEDADEIHMDADPVEPDRPRPTAVSVAANGNAYVVFQRSGSIQMIEDAAGETPVARLVGMTSDGDGASAVAATYSPLGPLAAPVVVVAEAAGLTQITGTPGTAARAATPAPYQLPVDPNTLALSSVSALAYRITDDIAGKGVLYAGTADSVTATDQVDKVLRYDAPGTALAPAAPIVHASGFSMVGGLGLRPGTDRIMVVDDPALVIEGEPIGLGRMFEIGDPFARVMDGPSNVAGQVAPDPRFTASTTPRFTFVGDTEAGARQQCSVLRADQPLTNASFADCTSPYTAPSLTTDGDYRFAVRTVENGQTSRPDVRVFTLDRLAPGTPDVVNPGEGDTVSDNPYLQFAPPAGEDEQAYECDFGNGTFVACAEGRRRFTDGNYTLRVRAVDGAGNVTPEGGAVVRHFTVGADTTPEIPVTVDATPLATPESWARYADGLHISTGALEAPDGSVWVTDHNAGLCRVSAPTLDGAGRIVHPELPSGTEQRTCLGGLLPHAREGADAAGSPALVDPTPGKPGSGDEVVLVPDGATKQKTLWRAQWNKRTKRFDPLDAFDGPPADPAERGPRPTAAAVGPDGNVYYVTKTADWIVQIRDAASDNPTARIVGYTSDGRGAESITVGGTATNPMVYVVEATGLTRLGVPAGQAGLPEARPANTTRVATAVTLPGIDPAVTAIGAVTFDRARGHLYVGTAAAALETDIGTDRVRRYVRGGTETSPTFTQVGSAFGGFSTVGGLAVRPDGRLLVADDPAIVTPGEPLGMGRLTQVGGPAARIAAGPSNLASTTARVAGVTANPTPSFTLEGDAALRCWLRKADTPAGTAPTWVDCGTTFAPASPLADGKWLLTVQSTVGTADANIAETLPFEVDTVAPSKPSVTGVSPLAGATTSAAPTFAFAVGAGDAGRIVAWTCRLNDKPEAECKPGRTFPLVGGESQLNDGQNQLVIAAIDRAGRKSPASDVFRFRADAVRPRIAFSAPAADQRQTSRTVAFAFSAGEADATYGCRLDGAPFRRCNVTGGPGLPVSWQQAADGTVTVTYAGLPDGAHTLEVHAQDRHGNLSGNVRRKVIVDNTAPAVAIAAPDAGTTTGPQTTATFAEDDSLKGEGEPAATFECTLDGTPIAGCDGSLDLTGLGTGSHTLSVVAVDDIGNRSAPVTRTWTVDARAATITFAAATPADGALVLDSPQIVFSASETATFRCSFNGEALRECRSPVREGSLKEGTHTVLIEATDAFGNVSTVTRRFTIVPRGTVIAPVQPLVQAPAAVITPLSAPLNGLATVRVSTTVATSTIRQAGLPVTVRVTDAANVVRIRVFRVTTARARAAAAKTTKKLVATVYKTTPDAGTYRFRLKDRSLRKLAAGRYVVEVRAGSSKKKLGRATQRTFTVKRSR